MDRIQPRTVALIAIVFSGFFGTGAGAQISGRGPNPSAPKLMVSIFKSAQKQLGADAADAVRGRIGDEVSQRSLTVFTKQQIDGVLEASGYPVTEALMPMDAFTLAKQMRADVYIEGTVTKTATGYSIDAQVMLGRDMQMVQPLGTFDGNKLDNAADKLARSFGTVYEKTFETEKRCRLNVTDHKGADAVREASAGIAAYGQSTWMRYCLLNSLKDQKRPAVEILKVVTEILAIDPRSKIALTEAVAQYDATGDKDKKIQTLQALYASDPTNSRLGSQIANELAAAGKFDLARPIAEKMAMENPGDVSLMKTLFNIEAAQNDTKAMAKLGEEMVKIDTSLADQVYFEKMTAAYASDSNFQKAAENAARATAKFPKVSTLWMARGQLENKIGQTQPAVESFKRALELDPTLGTARLQIINSYIDQSQFDSASAGVRGFIKVAKTADDTSFAASFAIKIGNSLNTAAAKLDPKTIVAYKAALPMLLFADSLAKDRAGKARAKFLIGYVNFSILQIAAIDAPKTKSCELAKIAKDALLEVQLNLPAGGSVNPEGTRQIMAALPQYEGAVNNQVKSFCK